MTSLNLSDIKAPIDVIFKQRVANLVGIGAKGKVLFATKDGAQTEAVKVYEFTDPLNITGISAGLKTAVESIFAGNASKVILVVYKVDFAAAASTIDLQNFDWLVCDQSADQTAVSTYGKTRKCKTVVYNVAADDMHVVNFTNPSVTLLDDSTQTGLQYLPRIAGVLAGLPYDRSASSVTFTDLKVVTLPADIQHGQFVLCNEESGVKVASPVNSLLTLGENITEDMKSITIVEGMDRMKADITFAFKESYKGKYKNKYDNQCLFISAVNGYNKRLAELNILDSNYNNVCSVDIAAQKAAWLEIGKTEASAWNDITVKNNTFKNKVILKNDVKFLDAMESLQFTVEMF